MGPHKTGTTALQGAFHLARQQLAEHGVHYAGKDRQPARAAGAKVGATLGRGSSTPKPERWDELCAEVAAAGDQRVVISSEYFCIANAEVARSVVEELGGERIHVVVTLRPLLKILPSQWQEYVQNGMRTPYEDWLKETLRQEGRTARTQRFWHRHEHGKLVDRWASIVGPENLTVVVVDETNPLMQLRIFEELVGLPNGLLVPDEAASNRSLTLGEVELIRQLNQTAHENKWSDERYGKLIRHGVRPQLRKAHKPSRDEPRVTTPDWAVDEVSAIAEREVSRISDLGVRVIGDLAALTKRGSRTSAPAGPPVIPSTAAASAVLAAILASQRPAPEKKPAAPVPAPRRAEHADTRTLFRVITRRGVRRLRRIRRTSSDA
ncbi:hypothetical protein [Streptomyces sp. NPDC002845]